MSVATTSRIVGFLQNPWTIPQYEGINFGKPIGRARQGWLRNLSQCASGKRLRRFDRLKIHWENASWVGTAVAGKAEPDRKHILDVLADCEPDVVLVCGKQAEKAVQELWDGALLVIPHPASRTLTNKLLDEAVELLRTGFVERIALRQHKGYVEEELL